MRYFKCSNPEVLKVTFGIIMVLVSVISNAQQQQQQQHVISFGIHADPVISWFSTDISQVKNDGARPGFNFGLTFNSYFTRNYSFSTGISLMNVGGRLVSSDTTVLKFTNSSVKVLPGNQVIYKLQYLAIPLGLKLQTNQIGYVTFFSDLGFVPKIAISRRADIPSLNISGENALNELRMINLSYHITGGIEYSLGGSTALSFGIDFDNNFLDITNDTGKKLKDIVSQKMLSFRFGINF
jgi:hypothetical protein